jgi:hypothetical protein
MQLEMKGGLVVWMETEFNPCAFDRALKKWVDHEQEWSGARTDQPNPLADWESRDDIVYTAAIGGQWRSTNDNRLPDENHTDDPIYVGCYGVGKYN